MCIKNAGMKENWLAFYLCITNEISSAKAISKMGITGFTIKKEFPKEPKIKHFLKS